jgi:hypothetical protein
VPRAGVSIPGGADRRPGPRTALAVRVTTPIRRLDLTIMKPRGRVLFSNVLRQVRLDGHRFYVEDDHKSAAEIMLAIGIAVCVLYGYGRIAPLFVHGFRSFPATQFWIEPLVYGILAIATALGLLIGLVRLRHRRMTKTLAWGDLAAGSLSLPSGPVVPISVVVPEIVESSTPLDSRSGLLVPERMSSWLLQLRLPDRVVPLGTSMRTRGLVPHSLLRFAHELHRLGFAYPMLRLLAAPGPVPAYPHSAAR